MTDTITLTGLVATVPHVITTSDRVPLTSFRLASSQRYFDRRTSQWVAGETNWYTVTAFRALATNAAASVHKGDRVIIAGRLKIRRWESGEKSGLSVDVEADSIGHDLVWGTAQYARTIQREPGAELSASAGEGGEPGAPDAGGGEAVTTGPDATVWPVTTPRGSADDDSSASNDTSDTPF